MRLLQFMANRILQDVQIFAEGHNLQAVLYPVFLLLNDIQKDSMVGNTK